jgi:hypothetical protein
MSKPQGLRKTKKQKLSEEEATLAIVDDGESNDLEDLYAMYQDALEKSSTLQCINNSLRYAGKRYVVAPCNCS